MTKTGEKLGQFSRPKKKDNNQSQDERLRRSKVYLPLRATDRGAGLAGLPIPVTHITFSDGLTHLSLFGVRTKGVTGPGSSVHIPVIDWKMGEWSFYLMGLVRRVLLHQLGDHIRQVQR